LLEKAILDVADPCAKEDVAVTGKGATDKNGFCTDTFLDNQLFYFA
jgi:hypothetical protein